MQAAEEGSINIWRAHGQLHYYLYDGKSRRYIHNQEKQLIERLCQKDYDQKVLAAAKKELKLLEKLLFEYKKAGDKLLCESVYKLLDDARKDHVNPIVLPDDEYIRQWENVKYKGKTMKEDAVAYYTDKGEVVRSKSEVLIANALKKHDIPYRYEYPLQLAGLGIIYPDFTVLNIRTRKELYFEHFGMMDDAFYCEKALNRIIIYEKNGIFPGDRLILTHETQKNPIDLRLLDKTILHYCK